MARPRSPELVETVIRRIDVAGAFASTEEPPTRSGVRVLMPLDAVPVLAVPPGGLPWDDLGPLARQLLLRVDGTATTMRIVTASEGTPTEGARELASLARRGLVRMVRPIATEPEPLEMDLTSL